MESTELNFTDLREKRMSFAPFITAVATQLINLAPSEIDDGINHALKLLGEYTQVDRSFLLLYQEKTLTNTHEWRTEKIRFSPDSIQHVPLTQFPWLFNRLEQMTYSAIANVAELPADAAQERAIFQQYGITALLVVPLTYRETFIGVLGLDMFGQTREWNEEISLLRIIGEMIINALKRKEIEQQEKLAYELGGQLAAILNKDEILHLSINQLRDTFGYYHAQVYLIEQQTTDSQHLLLHAATGAAGQRLKQRGHIIPLNATRSIVARAVRTGKTIVADDVAHIDYHLPNPSLPLTRSEIAIPLISEQTMIGCLDVQHTSTNHFDENAIRTLQIIAQQLSSSLAKADLFARNQKLVEELTLLQAVAATAAEAQDEDALLTRITQIMYKALPADSFGSRFFKTAVADLEDHSSYHYREKSTAFLRTNPGEGVTGYVFNTGKAKNIADVTEEPAFIGDPEMRSILCVPVTIQGRIIGVMSAESIKIAAFSAHDERLLTTIAGYTATAIEKIRLFANATTQAAETAALLATSKAISSLELEHVLNTIAQEAKQFFRADSCRVHLIDPNGKTMRCVVALGSVATDALLNYTMPLGQGIVGSVAVSGVAEIINNPLADRRIVYIPDTPVAPEMMALAPLAIRQQVMGVMLITRLGEERPFLPADLNLLTAFADQAAVAIDNARLFTAERRQLKELTILNKMATAAAKLVNADDLLKTALKLAHQSTESTHLEILMADHEHNVMRPYSNDEQLHVEMPMHQGIVGLVMASNQAKNIPDVTQEPDFIKIFPDVRSALCVPINIKGQAIGVINAESTERHAFTNSHERFLKTFAHQLAIGLEKIQLLEAKQNWAAKQEQLVALGISMLEAHNLEELWAAMAKVAQQALQVDRTAVYLYDEKTEIANCAFAHNLSPAYTDMICHHFLQVPAVGLLKDTKLVVIDDAQTTPVLGAIRQAILAEGFHSYAVFQMPTPDAFLGIVALYRDEIAPFNIEDQAIGQTLAYIASVAYQNIHLLTEVRRALIREQQLNDMTRWLSTAPNLPAILAATIQHSIELIGADAGLIGLVIDGQIMTYYPYNIPTSVNLRPTAKGRGVAWQVVETKEAVMGEQYQEHPQAEHKFIKVGARAFIAAPIVAGEECLGTLKLFSLTPGKTFSRRDLALAESIGRQVGIILQNRRLYTDLTERAQALAISLKKQEEADDAKNMFIHNVSHELRTPIGLIYGYSELLQSGGLGTLSAEQQSAMDIIVKRVRMLINLFDDMSVLLAAETQEFRREEIVPQELLQALIDEFQLEAEKLQIDLKLDAAPDLPLIIGDPFHLRRVFDNLLTNAFKFTPPHGTVFIRSWREEQELLIEIADTGVGIADEEMQRIFERFYQANAQSAKHHKGKGTGLGLALVKEIIEAHRGKVTVRSHPGQGTVFKIRLPGFNLS